MPLECAFKKFASGWRKWSYNRRQIRQYQPKGCFNNNKRSVPIFNTMTGADDIMQTISGCHTKEENIENGSR